MLIISSELGRDSYPGDGIGGVCELIAELGENNFLLLVSDKLEGLLMKVDGEVRSYVLNHISLGLRILKSA